MLSIVWRTGLYLALEPQKLGTVEAFTACIGQREPFLDRPLRIRLTSAVDMKMRQQSQQIDHEMPRMRGIQRGDRFGQQSGALFEVAILGGAPSDDPRAPCSRHRKIVLCCELAARFGVLSGERSIA